MTVAEKTTYLHDIAMVTAAGEQPLELYAAVETHLLGNRNGPMAIPEVSLDLEPLSRYQQLLKKSVLKLAAKHPVEKIYLQAPIEVYQLLQAFLPEQMIMHEKINFNALELPCIVAAIDSLIEQDIETPSEAAIAFFITDAKEAALAKLTFKKILPDNIGDAVVFNISLSDEARISWYNFMEINRLNSSLVELRAVLGELGSAAEFTGICYALGRLEYRVNIEKNIDVIYGENDETYESINIACA